MGGKKVNFDYYVEGKIKGVKGKWTSSNEKIATVDKNGVVKAVGNGSTTIYYTFPYKGKSYSMKTYVTARTRAGSCNVSVVHPEDFDGHMEVGETIDINRKLTPIAKAKAINSSIKSTYKTYGTLYDDPACKEEHDGTVATLGEKFLVTGESDGVVYFRANARNSKKNMDYNVNSNIIKITVGEGAEEEEEDKKEPLVTGAKQTDADKITVTSTQDISSIVVKLGNTVLTQRAGSPALAADKKSAVVSLPGNFQASTYKIFINDATEGIEVKCTTRTIDRIELDSEYAILDKEIATTVNGQTVYPKATVKYRVFDQFGNNITYNAAYPYTDFYNGGVFQVVSQGVMEFQFPFNPVVGTKYDVVLVHRGTGKTLKTQVELAKPAYVQEIVFAGIYKYDAVKGEYLLMADGSTSNMAEGEPDIVGFGGAVTNTKTNGAYYALFQAKNQYGGNAAAAGVGNTSLIVNLSSGVTNLNLEPVKYNGVTQVQSINPISIGSVDYLAYPLKSGALKEGTAMLTAFAIGGTGSVTTTLTVNSKKGIKNFTVSAVESLYEAKASYLDYSITDTYGNVVTDYNTLVAYSGLNDAGGVAVFGSGSNIIKSHQNSEFAWVKQSDGSAKLRYTPAALTGSAGSTTNMVYSDTITTMGNSVNLQVFSFSIYAKPIPTQIYGIEADAALGALTGGNNAVLRLKDIMVIDQYGADMSDELLKKSGFSIKVDGYTAGNGCFTNNEQSVNKTVKLADTNDNMAEGNGIYQPIVSLTTSDAAGSVSFNIRLNNGATDLVNSGISVNMKSVNPNSLVADSYKVTPLGRLDNKDPGSYTFEVTGLTSDGTRIAIPKERCNVYGINTANKFLDVEKTKPASGAAVTYDVLKPGKVSLGNDGLGLPVNVNGVREASFTYTIVIDDGRGSTVNTTVIISDEERKASKLKSPPEET